MEAQFLRMPQVIQQVGLSRSEIYRQIAGGRFPAPRKYPSSRKSYWLSTEVRDWQESALRD